MRRPAVLLAALLAFAPGPDARAAEAALLPAPAMADDGFYHPDWFLMSFLDLKDDTAEAAAKGKRVVVMIEQRGCGACKRVHEVNLRVPQVTEYLKKGFEVIQLDLYGSREVTDFDGQVLSEKDYAKKMGVRATPTMLFLKAPDEAPGGGNDGVAWRLTGYLEPEPFVNAFHFVASGAFKAKAQPDFLAWMKEPGGKVAVK